MRPPGARLGITPRTPFPGGRLPGAGLPFFQLFKDDLQHLPKNLFFKKSKLFQAFWIINVLVKQIVYVGHCLKMRYKRARAYLITPAFGDPPPSAQTHTPACAEPPTSR